MVLAALVGFVALRRSDVMPGQMPMRAPPVPPTCNVEGSLIDEQDSHDFKVPVWEGSGRRGHGDRVANGDPIGSRLSSSQFAAGQFGAMYLSSRAAGNLSSLHSGFPHRPAWYRKRQRFGAPGLRRRERPWGLI